jgi:RND family efflux transporter MFP subunit
LQLILVDGSIYPHQGKVAVLNRQVDPTTGTFKVAALFANPDNLLRPGQYGKIRATMSVEKGALLVPQRAVTEMQGKYLVAVVGADHKADVRPVTVGERIASEWIISKGLQPGDQIIAEGTQKVRPGMTVNPKPFVPAAPAAAADPARPAEKPAAPAPAAKD